MVRVGARHAADNFPTRLSFGAVRGLRGWRSSLTKYSHKIAVNPGARDSS